MLSQAALHNDIDKAVIVLGYIRKRPDLTVEKANPRTYVSNQVWIPNDKWKNEYGVRDNRLLDGHNPLRVAAAKSHVKILKLFLGKDLSQHLRALLDSVHNIDKKDSINTVQAYRRRENSYVDPVRTVVNDVFIASNRVPDWKARGAPDAAGLRTILKAGVKDLCWGGEVIAAAGLSHVDIFQPLAALVDVHQEFPHLIAKGGFMQSDVSVYVQGAYARTIGERALSHAVRNLRVENAKILIKRGVQLVEDIQPEPFISDDITRMEQVLNMSAALGENEGRREWAERQTQPSADGLEPGSWVVSPLFRAQAHRASSYIKKSGQQVSKLCERHGLTYKRTGDRTTYERRTGRSDPEWEMCNAAGYPTP